MHGPQATISAAERIESYGHPKEFIEKLHKTCNNVKSTLDNLPKLVEKLEQKRKVHEMQAQILLDVNQLESQQKLILDRFKENKDLLTSVSEGMAANLAIA